MSGEILSVGQTLQTVERVVEQLAASALLAHTGAKVGKVSPLEPSQFAQQILVQYNYICMCV